MNERIRELAEQADLKAIIDDAYQERDDWQPFVEKFAQLIVQECVNVLHDNDLWNRHISHVLNEHFGVES